MKDFFTLLFAVLVTLAAHSDAAQPAFLAEIQGTVTSQRLLGPNEGRIETDKLDNKRVFQAFGVSKDDYALIYDAELMKLIFRQRNSGGALPDIILLNVNFPGAAADTKKKFFRAAASIKSPAAGNLFEGLEGFAAASITYKGPIVTVQFDKFSFKFVGICRHPDPGSSSKAVLRFSLKTTREF